MIREWQENDPRTRERRNRAQNVTEEWRQDWRRAYAINAASVGEGPCGGALLAGGSGKSGHENRPVMKTRAHVGLLSDPKSDGVRVEVATERLVGRVNAQRG